MVDFVEEVEERLRAERYANFANRWLPLIVAAIVAIVIGWLGVWGWRTWQDRNIGKASITYDSAMNELASGDSTGAFTALAPLAKDGPAGYRALALMGQADIRSMADKESEAAGLYDQAAKVAPSPILRDLARLRAAQAIMDTAPYAQLQARLQPLIGERKPFDLLAREALAMAKIKAGKLQEARGDLNALSLTLGVSPAMRQRTQAAIQLIDSGQAAAVGAIVHQAATMTPSAANIPPELLGGAAPKAGGADESGGAPGEAPPPSGEAPAPAPQS
ncbi:MAG: tetratricopeptide repeat protein [Caulobacteraceae bacterium]|nr:tetratricopeptide repeat protein [Caulobacteraceae bacterium]